MAAQGATTLYHLLPAAEWEASQAAGQGYTPKTYAQDGFTHLSADADALCTIGNHFYGSIPGDFLVLSLDASKLTSPVRWEPAAAVGDTPPHNSGQQLFPHLVRAGPSPLTGHRTALTLLSVADSRCAWRWVAHWQYGPINADAVTEVTAVDRTPSGKMLGLLWGIAVVHNRGDWLKLAASS